MKPLKNFYAFLAACLSLILLLSPSISRAQMEVGVMGVYQNGKEVGRIYVPPRNAKDNTYVEHWVLYPGYLYPGKKRPGFETLIVPLHESFSSLSAFKNSLVLEPGSRIIEVLSHESKIQ